MTVKSSSYVPFSASNSAGASVSAAVVVVVVVVVVSVAVVVTAVVSAAVLSVADVLAGCALPQAQRLTISADSAMLIKFFFFIVHFLSVKLALANLK